MNSSIRNPDFLTPESLSAQWDNVAPARNTQLRSGKDVSFEYVLKPTIIELLEPGLSDSLLDAGCGSGVLTEALADGFDSVVGVDMSPINIELANQSATKRGNTDYVCSKIEDVIYEEGVRFSTIVANMVFQDALDLRSCLKSLAQRSRVGTVLISTITHPWFWPTYWGYDREVWFDYSKELAIEAPFRVSSDVSTVGVTTHFHRPLSFYVSSFKEQGFRLDRLIEPVPPESIQKKYPATWKFPRFLSFKCTYVESV